MSGGQEWDKNNGLKLIPLTIHMCLILSLLSVLIEIITISTFFIFWVSDQKTSFILRFKEFSFLPKEDFKSFFLICDVPKTIHTTLSLY